MVRKTVDATEEEFTKLRNDILDMSTEVASSADSIAEVMEMAGQLGIANESLTDFTKTMIMLGDSTNMNAGEAAETLARFANITGMSQDDFDKLGSTLVDLGNNYATTEGEIMTMALRLAGAGEQVGMAETDILGLATALSSVGIEAEMGGTALSKAMVKAENATAISGTKLNKVLKQTGLSLHDITLLQKNNKYSFNELATSLDMTSTELSNLVNAGNDLEYFAEISGMTAEEFTKAWEEDAAGALIKFIQGLGDTSNASENAITMLSEMGITEVRLRDSLVRAANASDLFNGALKDSAEAWKENTALVTEAERRYETVESQMQMAKNELIKVGIAIYDKFREPLVNALNSGRESIKKFSKQLQNEEMTEAIETIAKGIGDFVKKLIELATKVIPKVLSIMAKLIKNWDKIKPAIVGATTALLAYKVLNSKLILGMTTGNALMKIGSTIWALLTGKIKLATIAQKLFNAAQAATPWGLVALAIGTVVGGLVALSSATKEAKDISTDYTDRLKEEKDTIEAATEEMKEAADARKQLKETQKEAISEGLSELEYLKDLKEELAILVDENGKVKSGYEARVGFIISQLNEALGMELKMTDGLIENYQKVQEEIDNLIQKEQAYVIWEAQKPAYENAIKNKEKYKEQWIKRENEKTAAEATASETQKAQEEARKKLDKKIKDSGSSMTADEIMKYVEVDEKGNATKTKNFEDRRLWVKYKDEIKEYAKATYEAEQATKNLTEAEKNLDEANKNLESSNKALVDYEVTANAINEKNYKQVIDRFNSRVQSNKDSNAAQLKDDAEYWANEIKIVEAGLEEAKKKNDTYYIAAYENQLKHNEESLANTMKYLQQQTSTVDKTAPEVIQAWKDLAQNSTTEFLAYLSTLPEEEAKVIRDIVGNVNAEGENLVESWSTLTARSLSQVTGRNVEFRDAGNGMVQAIIDGKEVGEPQALNEMAQFAADLTQQVADKKISAEQAGEMLIDGVNNGVSDEYKQKSVLGSIGKFATKVVQKLKSAWDEHSPSKVSQGIAEYFMEGISKGFEGKENPILKQIRNFGKNVTTSLQGGLNQNDLTSKVGNLRDELNSTLQEKLGAIRTNVNGTVSLGANTESLNEIGQIQANSGKTVIINQTNNSPKSLDRLEIWRQTHNAATLAARS